MTTSWKEVNPDLGAIALISKQPFHTLTFSHDQTRYPEENNWGIQFALYYRCQNSGNLTQLTNGHLNG